MDPDLVAFTEFTSAFRDAITPLLARDFPHHQGSARRGHVGIDVYSRQRVSEWERLPDRRSAAKFRMELPGGGSCMVLLLHPDVPVQGGYQRRARFLQTSAHVLEGNKGPLVVLGDFNASWASADFRDFCRGHDLMVASRLEPTWHAGWPLFFRTAIDHVLVSRRHFASVGARTGCDGMGGDHLPVLAEVVME